MAKKTTQQAREFWERREIAAADKRIKAFDRAVEVMLEERRKRQQMERTALYGVLAFASFVVFLIWYTDGRVIDNTVMALRSVEQRAIGSSDNVAKNCQLAENRSSPYCQEKKAKTDGEWQGLSVRRNEQKPQFSLRQKEKR